MDAAINRFIYLLKRQGVRISPSESIDAMQALACVTPTERETVRTVLRSTLIKDLHDIPVFEELFELFFSLPTPESHPAHGHDHAHHHDGEPREPERIVFDTEDRGVTDDGEHAHGKPVNIRDFFDAEKMIRRFNPHQDPNQLSLSAFGQSLLLNRNKGLIDRVMKKVTHQLNVRRVKNLSRPGELNFSEALESLDEDLVIHAIEELLEDLAALEVDEKLIKQLAGRIDGIIANLPELLKRYIEWEMAPLPARFDVVTALHLLEHLEPWQTETAVANLWRLTARRLIIAIPLEETPDPRFGHRQVFDRTRLSAIGRQLGGNYHYDEYHGDWLVVDRRH